MNKMDNRSVAEIAEGLTEAQRRALQSAEQRGTLGKFFIGWWSATSKDMRALRKLGLAFSVWSGLALTDSGLSVRKHLMEDSTP